jgi:uncharacterized protein DUF6607
MTCKILLAALSASSLLVLAAPAAAAAAQTAIAYAPANVARDRQSILAMAGTFKVRFDFRETVSFLPSYTPIAPKVSGGHEVVLTIEDTPDRIVLQHLLVVDDGDGKPMVIKHWRQDWVYQPRELLTYEGPGRWKLVPVSEADAAGRWSQTVWQTDDSPRYGGLGRWSHDAGVDRWMSDETLRPLARRDAVRHPPYDRYVGVNRHAITPAGWVHEQDNAKIGPRERKLATYVHEVVLNTYSKASDFPVDAAEAYWSKTRDYWALVREDWDRAIRSRSGVALQEEAENGSVTGPTLMGLAEDVAEGKTDTAKAAAQAREAIAAATAR